MKIAASALLLATCFGGPAAAVCDPDLGCGITRTSPPAATPQATLSVRDRAAHLGLHRVEQVWTGDVVTSQGSVTTYTTNTASQDPGTYARRVASVATGEASSYDGVVFNGRRALSTGQAVAGDVYASYVVRGGELVLDRYVFFQDDLEFARRSVAQRPPASAFPVAVSAPVPGSGHVGRPAPAGPVPTPRPSPAASSRPVDRAEPRRAPPPRDVRAGIALTAQGDQLGRIEVLRGRAVSLWARATIDGTPARVTAWRLVSGELTALGPLTGPGDQPLVATWRALPPAGSMFALRFSVDVSVPGQGVRTVFATIDVAVRSPALVQ